MFAHHDPDRRAFLQATAAALTAARGRIPGSWKELLLPMGHSTLADELAALGRATAWINSPPLTGQRLNGRVVLVQFWTFTCINWLRTLPYVRAWERAYGPSGLVVIGVHTPEFGFEHDAEHVRRAAATLKVEYPVAVDSDYAIWRAFSNRYWPALYLFDATGRVRHHQFGEGGYADSERMIQDLLTDAGAHQPVRQLSSVDGRGIEAAADWPEVKSPENYLGYGRSENFASPGGARSGPRADTLPRKLRLNQWALEGEWTVERESIRLKQPNGQIACSFHSRDVHLVMGTPSGTRAVAFRLLLDGRPPGAAHGLDADAQGGRERPAPVSADPAAETDRGSRAPDRVPRSRCRGIRVHVRLTLSPGRPATR